MRKITPIILAGGIGTRLWPVSRQSYPKQFLKLDGQYSLFQQSVMRFQGPRYLRPIIVTHEDYRFHIVEQMGEIGALAELILLEPSARNTAPSICAAALLQMRRDEKSMCFVSPSDHLLPDTDRFGLAIESGLTAAQNGQIVTFGISPDRPETGYGYLELTAPNPKTNTPVPVRCFTEKPNEDTAKQMIAGGKHLWNAGIFLSRCSDLVSAFEQHVPEMRLQVGTALDQQEIDLGFTRLPAHIWDALDNISFDYAVMERATNVSAVAYDGHWSDLGSWQGLWREGLRSNPEDRLVTIGNAQGIECHDSLLVSHDNNQTLIGLGVRDLIAVAMRDAVLVADRSRSGEVGALVKTLSAQQLPQATTSARDFRPWGWFESLVSGPGFQVKLITVHPRGVLSLQSHKHRSEHWVVVEGEATVTIGDTVTTLNANESIYVAREQLHRLENNGSHDVAIIEVQTGEYLGEDDIIRYEDQYKRN